MPLKIYPDTSFVREGDCYAANTVGYADIELMRTNALEATKMRLTQVSLTQPDFVPAHAEIPGGQLPHAKPGDDVFDLGLKVHEGARRLSFHVREAAQEHAKSQPRRKPHNENVDLSGAQPPAHGTSHRAHYRVTTGFAILRALMRVRLTVPV